MAIQLPACSEEPACLLEGKPPVDGEALAMECLKQWEQGSRMRQTSRQKLYGFLNWAVQRGYLKPIYSPPRVAPRDPEAKANRIPP